MTLRERVRREHVALAFVLLASAVLELHGISHNGYANNYYSAAVYSMLRSWHNFFFVAADPSGLISVDKPPLGLWLQAASAELFGFRPLSVLLPEALCGIVAVGVTYRMLASRLGRWAAVAGAATLAVFPAFVASTRDNNLDALLILLMLLACWAMLRAIETDRLGLLLTSALLVGLAFNTKALAAALVVPGMAVGYLVCANGPLRRRILRLLGAGVVLAVVSLAWIVAVDSVPAAQRPYVGGTKNDSEVSLTLGYNGFGRVTGENGGPGETAFVPRAFPTPPRYVYLGPTSTTGVTGSRVPEIVTPVAPPVLPVHHYLTGKAHRATEPVSLAASPGPLRLFDIGFGDQAAWLLPFAALGMLALVLLAYRRVGRSDRKVAVLLVLGGWLATEVVVLSFSGGIVHPYYASALGPGVAAMVAAGAVAFIELGRHDQRYLALPALALLCTLIVQLALLHREYNYLELLWPVLGIVVIACIALLLLRPRLATVGVAVGLLAMLLVPALYSTTVWQIPIDGTFPAAGPYVDAGEGGIGAAKPGLLMDYKMLGYIDPRTAHTRWALLTESAVTAAPLILLGGHAAALGGYGTRDPVLTPHALAQLVTHGEARYVLLGGAYAWRGGNQASAAVSQACFEVPPYLWRYPVNGGTTSHPNIFYPLGGLNFALFDCKGHAAALAKAKV